MKHGTTSARLDGGDVRHTLKSIWARYRRRLSRCQRRLTEDALHDMRVQARRLLACVEVLSPIAGGLAESAAIRMSLRKRLSALGPLRDAQVHLRDFVGALEAHPEISPLLHVLRRRERRLLKSARSKLDRTGTRKLGRRIARFSDRLAAGLADADAPEKLRGAFARTVAEALAGLNRESQADFRDHDAVHAVRVSLKQLRYGAECLPTEMRSIRPAELKRVRKFVSWMGRIHDVEVQLVRMEKLIAKGHLPRIRAKSYRTELTRRRAALIRECLAFLRRGRSPRVLKSAPTDPVVRRSRSKTIAGNSIPAGPIGVANVGGRPNVKPSASASSLRG